MGKISTYSIFEIQKMTNSKIEEINGKLFEYIFYKWLNNKKIYDRILCDCYFGKEQIDCIGFNDKHIDIFECKLDVHSRTATDKKDSVLVTIAQINNKVCAINKDQKYKDMDINRYIVTFYDINPLRKYEFFEAGINTKYCGMINKLYGSKEFEDKTIPLLLFDWDDIFQINIK
jgi:hypothetical protein